MRALPLFVTDDPDLLEAGPTFRLGRTQINPAQQGYTCVDNYALYFWRPYLGNTAFALWELLLSFCYGENDTAYPSLARLARMLSNSDHNRHLVTGRRRGQRGTQVGALQVLRRERLVQVMRRGEGPLAEYTFRVLKTLPLLRPAQVQRLCPGLQRDHALWLERYGIDNTTYLQAFQDGRGDQPVAPAQGIAPATSDTAGAAACSAACAPASTNNTNQEDQMKKWWLSALEEVKLQVSQHAFILCRSGTRPCRFQDGVLTIRASAEPQRDVLEARLAPLLERELRWVSHGEVQKVRFVLAETVTTS
jgi:hypothetical protein